MLRPVSVLLCSGSGETAWRKKVRIMVLYGGMLFLYDADGVKAGVTFSLHPVTRLGILVCFRVSVLAWTNGHFFCALLVSTEQGLGLFISWERLLRHSVHMYQVRDPSPIILHLLCQSL